MKKSKKERKANKSKKRRNIKVKDIKARGLTIRNKTPVAVRKIGRAHV